MTIGSYQFGFQGVMETGRFSVFTMAMLKLTTPLASTAIK
jgi:hypothetical protein